MPPSEIIKPVNKQELTKALGQRNWKFLKSVEVVNRDDLRGLSSEASSLLTNGRKLCVAFIERE